MAALPMERVFSTGTQRRSSPSLRGTSASRAAWERKVRQLGARALPKAANIGRPWTGPGVGIEALASPIWAQTIEPPLITSSGLTPKKPGFQSTRSASLPTSTEPTWLSNPWAIAGLIVTLAM